MVFALSVPFWIADALTGLMISPDMPVNSFIWICPVIAASIVVYRENGTAKVAALLQ